MLASWFFKVFGFEVYFTVHSSGAGGWYRDRDGRDTMLGLGHLRIVYGPASTSQRATPQMD